MQHEVQDKQNSEQFFASTKLTIQKHLSRTPLLSKEGQGRLLALVTSSMRMLSDEEFNDEFRKTYCSSVSNDALLKNAEDDLQKITMIHIPSYITGEDIPKILVRQSLVERYAERPRVLMGGILEEISHGFHIEREPEELSSIKEGSRKLLPFSTAAELTGTMSSYTATHFTEEDLYIMTSGFFSVIHYKNDPEGSGLIRLPVHDHQANQEEARAALVRTIFSLKLNGSQNRPYGSLNEQLTSGLQEVLDNGGDDYLNHDITLYYALPTILEYIKGKNIAESCGLLLEKLYRMDVDTFFDHLALVSPGAGMKFKDLIDTYRQNKSFGGH